MSDIGKTILSVAQLVDKGYTVELAERSVVRSPSGEEMPLERKGGMFCLPAKLIGACGQFGTLPLLSSARGTDRVIEALPVDVPAEGGPPAPRAVPRVQGPASDEERQMHLLTHLPHAGWCDVCVCLLVQPIRLTTRSRERRRSIQLLRSWCRWTTPLGATRPRRARI